MSLGLTVHSSFDEVAAAIIRETKRRGYQRHESVACLSTGIQESNLRPDAVNPRGLWVGIYQQDASYPGRYDPNQNILEFLNRLDAKRRSPGASPDIWLNIFWLQQRPSEPSADTAYRNGRKAYLDEIKRHIAKSEELYDRFGDDMRPAFNEFPIWSKNYSSRGGKRPEMFLIHTQEGGGGDAAAENLAKWFQNGNGVSYHYTISQASDGGVTVVDCVDTDYAAWSVGNANSISVNLCFAGSRASWSRADWMKQANAIDVAAYLAVQDAKKYGFSTLVVPPPYKNGRPGISDHRWVTDVFGWGTHTDVGPNFPWDVFAASVQKYATGQQKPPGPAPASPVRKFPKDFTDRELLEYIAEQLGPGLDVWGIDGDLGRNDKGERRTLRAGLAAVMRKLGA